MLVTLHKYAQVQQQKNFNMNKIHILFGSVTVFADLIFQPQSYTTGHGLDKPDKLEKSPYWGLHKGMFHEKAMSEKKISNRTFCSYFLCSEQ